MNRLKHLKLKGFLTIVGLSATTGLAIFASACATPSQTTVDNLFKSANRFGDQNSGLNTPNFVATILSQDEAFKSFLDSAMGEVLTPYYENSPFKATKDKFKSWQDEINKSWDDRVQSFRNQFRNDFQVRLQTDALDPVGGTEASWKKHEMNKKVLQDFKGLIFQKDYLNYVNEKGDVVTKPFYADVEKQINWKNIKYTNQSSGVKYYKDTSDLKQQQKNINQMFADIQGFLSEQWVEYENPNLLSRVVFTNEKPEAVGMNAIFNEKLNSEPSASYEFQVFNPDKGATRNATGSYMEMVRGTGLSKYYNPANGTINIPNYLSNDSGGKLLMTASDMFSSLDTPFTVAFVNQYLGMQGDALSEISKHTLERDNIMNNFIRVPNNDPATSYMTLDYLTSRNKEQTRPFFAKTAGTVLNGYYKNYADLEVDEKKEPNRKQTKIFDIVKPKANNTAADESNQFILARGKDGVHILAIDGGKYYLSPTGRRDVAKQREFLLFRSLYRAKCSANISKKFDYSFDATTQTKTFFDKNSSLYLYQAFQKALTQQDSFLNEVKANEELKNRFTKLNDKINAFVQSMAKLELASNIEADVDLVRTKMSERTKTYTDNDKAEQSYLNGIAGKLPNVQAPDGSYPSLEKYYQNLASHFGLTSTVSITNGTRDYFKTLKVEAQQNAYNEALKLANALELQTNKVSDYSQVVILKSNADDFFSLPINLAINTSISSQVTTDSIKASFFKNSSLFNQFYDFKTGKLKTTGTYSTIVSQIQSVVDYYYAQSLLNSAPNGLSSFGVINTTDPKEPKDLESYKQVLANVLNSEKVKSNPNSKQALYYFTFLYTFEWLLRDNLKNMQSILSSQIFTGVPGLVSWTVPVAIGYDWAKGDPITTFDTNPNYMWGSKSNWNNAKYQPGELNISNTLANPYRATNIDIPSGSKLTTRYGFSGLSVQGDNKTDAALNNVLYTEFNLSKLPSDTVLSTGALYAYGSSRAEVIKYIEKQLTTTRDLDSFISFLIKNVGLSITDEKLTQDNVPFNEKQEALLAYVNNTANIPDTAFNRFTGYIGRKKSDNPQDSDPVQSSGGKELLPTYMKQVNITDVNALGAKKQADGTLVSIWMDANNPSGRLGLDLQEFLSVVAMQALDSGTQSSAITDLINKNKNTETTTGRIQVGDKRLFDALTSRWAVSINN